MATLKADILEFFALIYNEKQKQRNKRKGSVGVMDVCGFFKENSISAQLGFTGGGELGSRCSEKKGLSQGKNRVH